MTELDFIPQWYRAVRSRKLWHQRQYVIIGLSVLVIACGLMAAGRSLSLAQAKLSKMNSELESGIVCVQRFRELQSQLERLRESEKILASVSPRTPYAAVLAELSHCVGSNIVLSTLSFQVAPVPQASQDSSIRQKPARVQLGTSSSSPRPALNPMQTELVLRGVALNGSTVAELIAAMEESVYFSRVVPGFSKNVKLRDCDVAEFEIRCVLADFETIQ